MKIEIYNIYKYNKFIIIILLSLYSKSVSAEYNQELSILGVGYDVKEEEREKIKKTIYDRDLDSFLLYNGTLRNRDENPTKKRSYLDLEFNILKNTKNKENPGIFLGNNFYASAEFSKYELIFGRKSFSSLYRADPNWKDGMEGFGISTGFKNGSMLKIYLFDIYRGFPLLKNEFFIPKKNDIGDRLRYGLEYTFENRFFYINYHFSLTQFWNWGKFSIDRQDTKLGDGDFLYHNSLTFGYRFRYLNSYLSILSSRGVDKTTYDPIRKSSSLIFSGEAIQLGFTFDYQKLNINSNFFLPDTNKKNQQGEILELGYIGMGAYYSEGFLISQVLNFLPANWVTGNGLVISDTILNGTKNSYYQKIGLSYIIQNYKLQVITDLYIPYRDKITTNGNIYYDKKYFSDSILHEVTGSISTVPILHPELSLKLQISYLFPSFLHPYNGSSLFFSCLLKI